MSISSIERANAQIDSWKQKLLDLGKRNRLLFYHETKRSNIKIISPSLAELYTQLVNDEKTLTFSYPADIINAEEKDEESIKIIKMDIETDKPIKDQQKTLGYLRSRSKLYREEQGINALYLTFGFINWKERMDSQIKYTSPIILVPVTLTLASIAAPFKLKLSDDEIVVNPTLVYKFSNDFGIEIPEFDSSETDIVTYLEKIKNLFTTNGWEVEYDTGLSILSFQKMNMYSDLEKCTDLLYEHSIVKGLCGDTANMVHIPEECNNYDYDSNDKPVDIFQVVDADSSQQDAILLSKKGVSFVLQGPPGTGKSQTITNIIAESLADGKRVLFVSEKMAALDVVYRRLIKVGLGDFCLTLHNHKASKKEVLRELDRVSRIEKLKVQDNAIYQLNVLELQKNKLNDYVEQLHRKHAPLNMSIYDVQARIAELINAPDIIFSYDDIGMLSTEKLNNCIYHLYGMVNSINGMNVHYLKNPWRMSTISSNSHEIRHDIETYTNRLYTKLKQLEQPMLRLLPELSLESNIGIWELNELLPLFNSASECPTIPATWIENTDINALINEIDYYKDLSDELSILLPNINKQYSIDIYNVDMDITNNELNGALNEIKSLINKFEYSSNDLIAERSIETICSITALSDKISACLLNINSNTLELRECNTFNDILGLKKFLDAFFKNPVPTEEWFNSDNNQSLNELALEVQEVYFSIEEKTNLLLKDYNKTVFDISYLETKQKIQDEYDGVITFIQNYIKKNNNSGEKIQNQYSLKYKDILDYITNELTDLKEAVELADSAILSAKNVSDLLGFTVPETLYDINPVFEILKELTHKIRPTESWFYEDKRIIIRRFINEFKENYSSLLKEKENLLKVYDKDILKIDCKAILASFKLSYTSAFKVFNKKYREDRNAIRVLKLQDAKNTSDNEVMQTLLALKKIIEYEEWIVENEYKAIEYFGSYYNHVSTDWDLIENNISLFENLLTKLRLSSVPNKLKTALIAGECTELIITDYEIIERYLNSKSINIISKVLSLDETKLQSNKVSNLIKVVNTLEDSVLTIKNTLYDLLKHKRDFSSIGNVTIDDIFTILDLIESLKNNHKWINNNKDNIIRCFGAYYKEELTDWKVLQDALSNFQIIKDYYKNLAMPEIIIKMLKGETESKSTIELIYNDINGLLSIAPVDKVKSILTPNVDYESMDISMLLVNLIKLKENLAILLNKHQFFTDKSKINLTFEKHLSNLKLLCRIQEINCIFKKYDFKLKQKYDFYYTDSLNDWDKAIDALKWTDKFLYLASIKEFKNDLIRRICTDVDTINLIKENTSLIKTALNDLQFEYNWFTGLFTNKEELIKFTVPKLIDYVAKCAGGIHLLEEWVDYRINRDQCIKDGIEDFLLKADELNLAADDLPRAFKKRIYKLWLDNKSESCPAIINFRRSVHDDVKAQFNKLDKDQLMIAQLRIKERLSSKIPDLSTSYGEVSILKRELNKQRRIMPVRKLFRAIPNLLTLLKPCLMMSPLSVSLFLQAELNIFDIVIFDEASQICTEDAIGAILRGKQVIIAGDNKQLPPSKFFATSISEEEYDDDKDDDNGGDGEDISTNIGTYESILDEAGMFLPFRGLKWHYRSKHEHLIAFSNVKIYDNSLITFPSNIDKAPHTGVEYIYVQDGVYDRGGKKDNINEANKVIDIVHQHIKEFPNRSLGIVTFSLSQQQAVETAIRKFRLENQYYEHFFNEDKEEAFFIKNLENVQGDERDTIIFSIGYAKDVHGKMYMNFGPLSKSGGYRRLNVAITRAKYNIKLVGSILPTDIDISKTNSDGVKMLRSYIEFAISGAEVLKNELSYSETKDFDSPFEESVCNFLIHNGFNVATQVGCSGYRIDLAVKHPTLDGRFVLGIECDGATYHSARTARERDRLRQAVLENVGWKIYRIWSTDWIKNTRIERERLLEAVNKAVVEYSDDINNAILNANTISFELEDEVSAEIEQEDNHSILYEIVSEPEMEQVELEYYIEADIKDAEQSPYKSARLSNAIKHVIEIEQPVHIELLSRRVVNLMGQQKATTKIINEVRNNIRINLKDIVEQKGDFYTLRGFTEIKARKHQPNMQGRNITHISTEEIAEAMLYVVKTGYGVKRNILYMVTARAFGFQRTGQNITSAMESALNHLIQTKCVKDSGGKIVQSSI